MTINRPVEEEVLAKLDFEEKLKQIKGTVLFYILLKARGWTNSQIARHRGVRPQSVGGALRKVKNEWKNL